MTAPPANRQAVNRWGIPTLTGQLRFVAALAIDAIGTGVFMPVAILYFIKTTALPTIEVGAALTLAAAIALPIGLTLGSWVDRWGAKPMLLAANAAQAVGMLAFLWTQTFWAIVLWSTVVTVGRSAFWASYGSVIAAISRSGERELWFGFVGSLRNVSFVAGGLLAALLLSVDTAFGYQLMPAVNALSFGLAFGLLWPIQALGASSPRDGVGSWRSVVTDVGFAWMVASQFAYCLGMSVLNFALPLYLVAKLGLPSWLVAAIYVVNCVLVGFGQSPTVARLTGRVRWRVLALGHVCFAASYAMFWLVADVSSSLAGAAIALALSAAVVLTAGEILGGPVAVALLVESADPAHYGRYLSVWQLTWNVSSMIAPLLFAWLLTLGVGQLWWPLMLVSAAGLLAIQLASRRVPEAREPITNLAASATA